MITLPLAECSDKHIYTSGPAGQTRVLGHESRPLLQQIEPRRAEEGPVPGAVPGNLVVRAVVFEPREAGEAEAGAQGAGLERWLGGTGASVSVRLRVLRVSRLGLLVQRPPEQRVSVAWSPVLHLKRVLGATLCRYHEGPEGRPWEHLYCTRLATTRDGYCSLHARSGKALYERCAQGVDAACREADRLLGPREYVVYALDYGAQRLKIGLTQAWRLLWRLAEQPHVSAAVVATRRSLVEARGLEKSLGRHRGATEGAGARLRERLRLSVSAAERTGAEARARRLAALLAGLGLRGSYEAYSVEPLLGYQWLLSTPGVEDATVLEGRRLRVLDYWGGLVLVEDTGTGERLAVPKHLLLHRVLAGDVEPGG